MRRISVALVLALGVALALVPGAASANHTSFHVGAGSGHTSFAFSQGHERFQGHQHFVHHPFVHGRGFIRHPRFPVAVSSPVIFGVYPAPRVVWVPARWAWTGFEWVWVPGHWAQW